MQAPQYRTMWLCCGKGGTGDPSTRNKRRRMSIIPLNLINAVPLKRFQQFPRTGQGAIKCTRKEPRELS